MAYLWEALEAKSISLLLFSSTAIVSLAHEGAQYTFIELNQKEGLPVDWNFYLGARVFPYKLKQETDFCSYKQIHFHVFFKQCHLKILQRLK